MTRAIAKGWLAPLIPPMALLAGLGIATAAFAQPSTRNTLPLPSADQSAPAWPRAPQAPAGEPNVLLILTDDVGFAASDAFGGPIPTPVLDDLARRGLRYNEYQNSAICSATRAALLTGRNPHHVGMGRVTNVPTRFPGYTGFIPRSAGTIAQILRQDGYRTAAFGKWHLIPEWEESPSGPFEHWPTGMGFEDYYGFVAADTNQYNPALYQGTSAISHPEQPGYILDRDLADRASAWIGRQHEVAPDKPFFIYYAPGSTHAPHQAPADWIAKFKGRFDRGWDAMRQESFARQKAMGIIPANTILTPRPEVIPAWASLSAAQHRLYARMMEINAAQLAYCDDQIGRLIDTLRRDGTLDNTMIIFIQGDNGASAEGGAEGSYEEQAFINRFPETIDYMTSHIDDLGGPKAYENYPAGWAWAMDTPFQYYKQIASHLGGVRNGMVISWPARIKDVDKMRSQFHFVSDVLPTILDAAGVAAPAELDGVRQMPLDGTSMVYTFDHPDEPSHRRIQPFETMQNLAIYADGWWAGTTPAQAPWDFFKSQQAIATRDRPWELYDLTHDYSQGRNLAAKNPAKLREMQALFWQQAAVNDMLPIHPPTVGAAGRPSVLAGRSSVEFTQPITRLPTSAAPDTIGHSFDIDARINLDRADAQGVIVTHGGRFGGYALYLDHGVPVFHYNALGDEQYVLRAPNPLGAGPHRIQISFAIDLAKPGSGGTFAMTSDGAPMGSVRANRTLAMRNSLREGLDIGEDTLTPISDAYTIADSKLQGKIVSVTISVR